MRNGVIAVRRNGSMVLMNDEAYRILGITRRKEHADAAFTDVLRDVDATMTRWGKFKQYVKGRL